MKKDKHSNNKNLEFVRKDNCCSCNDKTKPLLVISCFIIIILMCAIAVLVYKGNQPKLMDGKQIVASIDGKNFTADELYENLNKKGGYSVLLDMINNDIIGKEIQDTKEAEEYANSVIKQYEASYKSSGMNFEDALKEYGYGSVSEYKELVKNSYLYNEVAKKYIKEKITEKELKTYYENHISDELNVKHILIAPEVDSSSSSEDKKKAEEAALNKAKDLIEKLNNGADFDTLAKENSDDEGSAKDGGAINNVVKGTVVTEFWDAAIKLETGKYTTTPVKSAYGYHIIYKVSQTEKKPFDDMKDTLYDEVLSEKISSDETLIDKTWIEVHKKYNLAIIDTSIANAYEKTVKQMNK